MKYAINHNTQFNSIEISLKKTNELERLKKGYEQDMKMFRITNKEVYKTCAEFILRKIKEIEQ